MNPHHNRLLGILGFPIAHSDLVYAITEHGAQFSVVSGNIWNSMIAPITLIEYCQICGSSRRPISFRERSASAATREQQWQRLHSRYPPREEFKSRGEYRSDVWNYETKGYDLMSKQRGTLEQLEGGSSRETARSLGLLVDQHSSEGFLANLGPFVTPPTMEKEYLEVLELSQLQHLPEFLEVSTLHGEKLRLHASLEVPSLHKGLISQGWPISFSPF
ncbi:hypothetical protein R1sor_017477 [Riccia sorocarpa]|uniref:Uncharacterized protein n=1 Tax=Riccia sorocarpa TaxID=122646 RepID=A0ABD3IAP6_9MARC